MSEVLPDPVFVARSHSTFCTLDPVVTVGSIPTIRNPITLSDDEASYRLPPPELDEHGAELRRWLKEPLA